MLMGLNTAIIMIMYIIMEVYIENNICLLLLAIFHEILRTRFLIQVIKIKKKRVNLDL